MLFEENYFWIEIRTFHHRLIIIIIIITTPVRLSHCCHALPIACNLAASSHTCWASLCAINSNAAYPQNGNTFLKKFILRLSTCFLIAL